MDNCIKLIYEYSVLRYVPDLERGEFINIGLLMMCKKMKWIQTEIQINEPRILNLTQKSNLDILRKQSSVFENTDLPSKELPVEEKYRWMAAVKSAIIQTSPSHPGILILKDGSKAVDCLEAKFKDLFKRLVI